MSEPLAETPRAPSEPSSEGRSVPADIERMAFDQALAELQSVVARLEAGGLALESSIELYERGVALHAQCARLLSTAELRVQRLVEGAGGRLSVLDLRPDDES